MLHVVLKIVITALAVMLSAKIVPGVRVKSFGSAVAFSVVLALLAWALHWILVLLALPIIIVTFGLFLLVINAFLFWLADKFVDGVEVDGFGSAFIGSLLTSLFTSIAYHFIG